MGISRAELMQASIIFPILWIKDVLDRKADFNDQNLDLMVLTLNVICMHFSDAGNLVPRSMLQYYHWTL